MRARVGVFAVLTLALLPFPVESQLTWRDFVVTGGLSGEGYRGNLPSVGIVVRDSTELASAVIGEVGVRGDLAYLFTENGRLGLAFDGGLRQFSASGFELRDYAPREWVGTVDLDYRREFGRRAEASVQGRLRGRQVDDRPPMPLFLQPGYLSGEVSSALEWRTDGGVVLDGVVSWQRTDFRAPAFSPQVRLLDRTAWGMEGGASRQVGEGSVLRFFVGVEASRYPEQQTALADDPFRKDRTFEGGVSWTHQADVLVQLGAEARANRSNSLRPEYDALTARGLVSTSLPRGVTLTAYLALTGKRYVHSTDFARLLPGEEANNASLAYVSVSRLIAQNLDGTLRVGWTRAETEIGDAYFQRAGASLLLHYRPRF